ncbi:MAG: hypothetical protein QXM53_07655 [Thermofilaceae archaeon]
MGYPVKTVNLNILSIPFRKVSSAQKWDVIQALEHDFRQYEYLGKPLPKHINQDKISDNLILYINPYILKKMQLPFITKILTFQDLKNNFIQKVDETLKIFAEINEKEKEKRRYLEEKTKIKITANPFVGFVINFSKLAQKEIIEKVGINYIANSVKDFVLTFFEDLMGAQVLYLVCHLDESAPHFHGIIKNFRNYKYKFNSKKDLIEDVYFNYLLERLRLIDLRQKIANGLFKTFSGSFSSNIEEIKNENSHKLPFSFLQDVPALYFSDLGFERGKSKQERLAEGEPYWKIISRDVKTLHEDLPKEIAFKKEELRLISDLVAVLTEEKEKLTKEKTYLEKEKEKIVEEKTNLEKELENIQTYKIQIEKELAEKKEKIKSIEKKIEEKEKELFFLEEECIKIKKLHENKEKLLTKIENKIEKKKGELKRLRMEYENLKKKEEELWNEINQLRREKVCSEDELEFIYLIRQILKTTSLEEIEEIEEKLRQHKFLQLLQLAKTHIEELQSKKLELADDYEITLKEIIAKDEKALKLFYNRVKQIQRYEIEKAQKEK